MNAIGALVEQDKECLLLFGEIQEEDELSASDYSDSFTGHERRRFSCVYNTPLPLSWLILGTISSNSTVKAEGCSEEDLYAFAAAAAAAAAAHCCSRRSRRVNAQRDMITALTSKPQR